MQKLGEKPLINFALQNAFQLSNNVFVSTEDDKISSYSKKIAIRDARTKIRESLAKAKEIVGSPSAFKTKSKYNKAL